MHFRRVLDLAVALLVEVYRELGLKFDETMDELEDKINDVTRRPRKPPEAQNQESLAVLNAMMMGSDFKGVRR